MLGSIEVSAEYVRLWNLMSRCRSCRKFRRLAVRGVDVQIVVKNGKVVLRKKRVGVAMPCIENCDKMTAEEKRVYDILRFQELKEVYEPMRSIIVFDITNLTKIQELSYPLFCEAYSPS